MFRGLANYLGSKTGATAVEYALLASGIALVILVAVANIGTNLSTSYSEIGAAFR
jgi:pilus assembly protein Flp/PilA